MVKFSSGLKAVISTVAICTVIAPVSMAQDATNNEAMYSELLQAIADQKISIAQKQVFIARQEAELASLEEQLAGLEDVKAAVPPMVEKMTAAIGDEISADFPFQLEERMARLGQLQDMVGNPEAKLVEKLRKALSVYKIEVNYGQSLESYQGNHPITPTIRQGNDRYKKDVNDEFEGDLELDKNGLPIEVFDGNYLRYGRTAFVYLNEDGSDPLRYDLDYEPTAEELEKCQGNRERCKWRKIPNSKAVEIRRAIRVSRGEIAPTVVAAPVSPTP
ncbi:MAG: DUF3450 family protein [Hyphomonadaceae bacterium]|nr:DUF3450 family protein [Hyphomonadaceae bacterium]